MTTIAITGATGQLGRLTINRLKAKIGAQNIIALARNAEKAKDLGVTVRVADYEQPETLEKALNDPGHDRHRVRLLIKRVRYGAEAYPKLDRLPARVTTRLKEAQKALGQWHDAWQWLQQAQQHPDLQPCVEQWRATLVRGEKRADRALIKLSAACFHS